MEKHQHQHQQKDDRTNRKRGRGFSPRRLGISVVAICIGLLSFAQVYMFHQHQHQYHHDNHNHNHNHNDLPVEFYQMSKQTKRAKKESQLFRSRRRQQQQQQQHHQDSNGFLPKQHKHQKGGNGNGNGNGNRMEYNDDCEENDDALGITSGVLRKFLKMEKTEKLRNRKEFQSRIDRYVAERLSETNSKSASTTIHAHEHEQAHEQAHEHESGGANNADPSKIFVDLDSDPNPAAAAGSDNDNDGPWMVLHIGPPKTATTTIQCGLEKYSLRLAKTDGYHYLGGGCGFPKKEYIMPNGEAVVLRRHLLMALHNIGRERLQRKSKQRQQQQQQQQPNGNGNGNGNDCGVPSDPTATEDEQLELLQTERSLGNFLARVSRLRKKHRSVILSGEQFGSQLSHRHPVMDRATSMLTASPDGAGFAPEKVRIILAYRHFVDWLPSFHYQQFLILDSVMDHEWVLHRVGQRKSRRVKPFLEYADQYLTNWENHQTDVRKYLREELANGTNTNTGTGTGSAPVLPSVLPKDRQSIHPSWWLYTVWSSYFPLPNQVQVYDMHSPMNSNRPDEDMVTDFICHMLPSAKNTCQRLKDEADGAITAGIAAKSANTNPVVVAATAAAAAAAAGNHLDRLDHFDYLDYDYENPRLHSTFSLLHPNRTDERLNLGSNTGSKSGSNANVNANVNANANTDSDNKSESGSGSDNNGKQQQQQQMNIRPSSAHHAIRIVEELLLRQEGDGGGGILPFPDDDYDARYFDTEVVAPTDPDSINGYTKPMLVQRASELLEAHGIYSSSSSSSSSSKQNNATTVLSDSSSYEERFSDRYFDCITPELEERLLNATRIFLDLMYKHTPMLSLATAATYGTGTGTGTVVTGTTTTTTTTTKPERGLDFDNGRDAAYADGRDGHADGHESHGGDGEDWEKILEEEKGKRWAQAKDEHERLFEKNKKKGKYCDINPDKVFRNNPEVYEELVAMRYKPSFRQFLWNELSEAQKGFAKQLGFVKDTWQGRKNALVMLTDWKELSPEQKAGAFRLGWNQDAWDTIAFRLREFLEKQGT